MRILFFLLLTFLVSCHDIPCQECNSPFPQVKQDTFYLADTSNLIFKRDLRVIWENGENRVIFNPIYVSTYQDTYSVKYEFGTLKYDGTRVHVYLDSTLNLK